MRLVRFGQAGQEKPGVLDAQGQVRDASAVVQDYTAETLGRGLLVRLAEALDRLPVVAPVRLGPPVRPGNILCIGLNYRDHAAEANMPLPKEPIVFSKHTSALCGPDDAVPLPPGSTRSDWEVELAVVIGKAAWQVSRDTALDHVLGYSVANDLSERSYQLDRGGQWIKGKSCPNFCPLGPALITADEVPDPQALRLWLSVNGTMMQDGSTADMVFDVATLIAELSTFMVLQPGDVILTGTPKGVGMGRNLYLKAGDVMRLGIDGLGEQTQTVV